MKNKPIGKYGMNSLYSGCYAGTRVLVTGHTGFKGSWLVYWLSKMDAVVAGYSLKSPTQPNHYDLLNLNISSFIGDVRDSKKLNEVVREFKPQIVFHLAAQPLVRSSYDDPILTYETNVIGTLKVLEACRKYKVESIVNITSDKSYQNNEWIWGYKENDILGGFDPYSSSKGCADILTNSYRNSFFNIEDYKKGHETLLAACRAGNVIGGGDWAKDRLITDVMSSASKGRKVLIRNLQSTRPWQHVLEPLSGYLMIGQKLLNHEKYFGDAWNFGPSSMESYTVSDVMEHLKSHWDAIDFESSSLDSKHVHEARLLKLDCTKANTLLKWRDVWDMNTTFEKTVEWYKAFYLENKILTSNDLDAYVEDAKEQGLSWAGR